MKRFIIITTILFLGVCFATYYYFEKLNNSTTQNKLALQTALQNSFCTVAFTNERTFFEVIKDYTLFDEILGEDKSNELLAIKNLIVKNNRLNKWILNRKIFISLIPDTKNSFDLVFIAQLNREANIDQLAQAMNTGGTKANIENEQFKIEGQLGETFYAMIRNNMAIVSKNSNLVRLIAQNKLNNIREDMKEFLLSDKNNSKNSLAQLYLNTQKLEPFYQALLVNKPTGILNDLLQSDALSVLNFNYSKNKLQFTGSSLMNGRNQYLQSFINQKPQKITLTAVLPNNTSNYAIYTFSDFISWQQDLDTCMSKDTRFTNSRKKLIEKIASQDSISLIDFFAKQVNHEVGYVQLNTGEKLGIINLQNPTSFQNEVKKLVNYSVDSTFRFKTAGVLPHIFGNVFENFNLPYLKIIGKQLVIANLLSTIHTFENAQTSEELLQSTANYTDFSNQIIPEANVSYFINNFDGKAMLKNHIRWEFYQYYIPDKSNYHQIYGFGVQLSAENNQFQTTATITNRVDRTDFQ